MSGTLQQTSYATRTGERVARSASSAFERLKDGNLSGALSAIGQVASNAETTSSRMGACLDVLGPQLSALLPQASQAEVVMLQGRTLATTADGQADAWTAPDGTQVTVTAKSTRQETEEMVVLRETEVEPPKSMGKIIGKPYQVTAQSGADLTLGPAASTQKVRQLAKDDTFTAVTTVPGRDGGDYILVAENNVWTGYLPAKAAKLAGSASDEIVVVAADRADAGGSVVAEEVRVKTTCRTLQSQAKTKTGQKAVDTQSYCQAPDGAWVVQ